MKESYETRKSRASGIYGTGQKRVATTPEPEGQKFPCGSRVRIADDLGSSMRHFLSGKDATVMYVYAHAYGGNNVKSYSLDIDGHGNVSWYDEDQLTAIDGKTRTTAARLGPFMKADHWSQWRVEEGFASHAECVAENKKEEARAARWQSMKDRMGKGREISFPLLPEHSEVRERCEHDLPKHICAVCNWVDEPILTSIPQKSSVAEAIQDGVREGSNVSKGFLNKLTMNDEPLECCVGYRQESGELVPDHLAVFGLGEASFETGGYLNIFDHKEDAFFLAPVSGIWQRFKAIDWRHEIKDAFSFLWCKRINGIVHTPWEMANGILKINMSFSIPAPISEIEITFSFKFPTTLDYQLPKASFKECLKDAFPFFWSDRVQAVKKSMELPQERYVWRTTEDQRIGNIGTSEWPNGTELFLDPDRPGALTDIPPLGSIPHNCRCVAAPLHESWVWGHNISGRDIEEGEVVHVAGIETINDNPRFLFDVIPDGAPLKAMNPIAKDQPGWALDEIETERINKP